MSLLFTVHCSLFMLFNVPQFLDIEDKIVWPLTAKQLGWLAMGGVILLVLYGFLDNQAMIIAGIIVGGICGAFAFYRPYNQPLIKFIFSSIYFVLRPKIYVWKRDAEKIEIARGFSQKKEAKAKRKKIDSQKISEVSKILDQK